MLKSMSWLQAAPGEFRAEARALAEVLRGAPSEEAGLRLYRLAQYALDENQLTTLARLSASLYRSGAAPQPFARVKLGVFGDGTLSLLAPAIAGAALRH